MTVARGGGGGKIGGSAGTIDPAVHQPVTNLVEGGWSRRRVLREPRDHLARTVQILFGRRRPVDLGVQQRSQALEAAKLDRVEYVTRRWNLLCHPQNVKGSLPGSLSGPSWLGPPPVDRGL